MIVNPILYQQGTKLPELENPGTAADLLAGKQLVDQYGNPLTGTMPTATHPKPTLSRSGGTVTAQHVQSAGYTEGGTTTETLTIPTKAGTTITPGTSRKTAVSGGYLTTGAVYVAGDTNLKAENIKSGVSIFGVAGTLSTSPIVKIHSFEITNNNGEDIYLSTPSDLTSISQIAGFGMYASISGSTNYYLSIGYPYSIAGSALCYFYYKSSMGNRTGIVYVRYDSTLKQIYMREISVAELLKSNSLNSKYQLLIYVI